MSDMNVAEQKAALIRRIRNAEDPHIIAELNQLLDFELDNGQYCMNAEQQARVSEGRVEYCEGNTLTDEQADDAIEQWLNER